VTERRRVLAAVTDPSLLSAVRCVLDEYTVVECPDDDYAAVAIAWRPDLIVLDARKAVFATHAVATLRDDFRTAHTPILHIVDMTPRPGPLAETFGANDDYVVAPVRAHELTARVHLALGRSSLRRGISPLTGLPGNVAVEAEIASRGALRTSFSCLYVDLDGFKAFNDEHGFVRGDEAITLLARTIDRVVGARAPRESFLGHLGGDDFVVLTPPSIAHEVAAGIIEAFDAEACGCSISIGVVEHADALPDPECVADAAARSKAVAKRRRGSSWAVQHPADPV
jgi:diguanylate cyclase (GGDEF)-like protein